MRTGEITRVVVDAVVADKLRSLLTVLGVIIGIASVITMVALGNDAQKQVQDRLGALDTTCSRCATENCRRRGGMG